jgi:hypothetical protein
VTFTTEEVIFHKALMPAFASWLQICNIPNNVKTDCLYSIPEISRSEKLLPSRILATDLFQMFDFFLTQAGQGYDFFLGIADQMPFPLAVRDLASLVPAEDYMPKVKLIWDNCGTFLAMGMSWAIDPEPNRRSCAIDFLKSISLLICAGRDDSDAAAEVIDHLDSVKPLVVSSFLVFLQDGFDALNGILARRFGFCSEQFISQCFSIISRKQGGVRRSVSLRAVAHEHRRIAPNLRVSHSTVIERQQVHKTQESVLGVSAPPNISIVPSWTGAPPRETVVSPTETICCRLCLASG